MTRQLKTFGAALVAVFAMGAVVASGAMAVNDTFESPSSATGKLTATQEGANKFTLAGSAVECSTVTFAGSISGLMATEVTGITSTLGGCTLAGKSVAIHLNGCTFTVTGTTDAEGDAQTKIVCPAGKHITSTLDANECVITVKETGASNGSQTATKGVSYTNVGTGTTEELLVHITVKVKIQSEQGSYPKYGVACAAMTCTTAELEGTVKVTGEDLSNNHVPITVK